MSLIKREIETNWAADSVAKATCGCTYQWDDKFVEYCSHHLTEMEGESEWHEEMRRFHEENEGEE